MNDSLGVLRVYWKVSLNGKRVITEKYADYEYEKEFPNESLEAFVISDSVLGRVIHRFGIEDCARVFSLGGSMSLPIKPVIHFPEAVEKYAKHVHRYCLGDMPGKDVYALDFCEIMEDKKGLVHALLSSGYGNSLGFGFLLKGDAFVQTKGRDSDGAKMELELIGDLLPSVINETLELVRNKVKNSSIGADSINFWFSPRRYSELGRKLMIGFSNVPKGVGTYMESNIYDGSMEKGTLAVHYIWGDNVPLAKPTPTVFDRSNLCLG